MGWILFLQILFLLFFVYICVYGAISHFFEKRLNMKMVEEEVRRKNRSFSS